MNDEQQATEFIFFCISVFALTERKNRNTEKRESTMLPQAKGF
jgi:hypothetical protein